MIQLTTPQLTTVRAIWRRHIPDRQVLVFGSRAQGKAKPFSDLDLAIMGLKPLTLAESSALQSAFSASDLPFKVDLVDWASVSDEFRRVIKQSGKEIKK